MAGGGGNPWGAVVAGAGQAVMSLNEYLASERRDEILKQILERRQRQQDEMDAMVMGEVGTMRGETPEAERAQAMSEFTSQLRDARAATPQAPAARFRIVRALNCSNSLANSANTPVARPTLLRASTRRFVCATSRACDRAGLAQA